MTAGDVDNAVGGLLEISASDNGTREAGVEAVAQVFRKGCEPLARRGQGEEFFRVDVGTIGAEALTISATLTERRFGFGHPRLGHQTQDLFPVTRGQIGMFGNQASQDGLGPEIIQARTGFVAGLGLQFTLQTGDDFQRGVWLILNEIIKGRTERGARHLSEHSNERGGCLALLPVIHTLLLQDAQVFVPDALHLIALSKLRGLLRGEKRGHFSPKAFVRDLFQISLIGEISTGQFLESARQQKPAGRQTARGILTTEVFRTPGQTFRDPETFRGRDDLSEHLTELADFDIRQFARDGIGQGEDILKTYAVLRAFGKIGQHLIVDATGEVRWQFGEFGANHHPVSQSEGMHETHVGGRIILQLSRALHGRENLIEVAGEALAQQVLILLLRLSIEGLLGGKAGGQGEGSAEQEGANQSHVFIFSYESGGTQEPLSGIFLASSKMMRASFSGPLGTGAGPPRSAAAAWAAFGSGLAAGFTWRAASRFCCLTEPIPVTPSTGMIPPAAGFTASGGWTPSTLSTPLAAGGGGVPSATGGGGVAFVPAPLTASGG